MNNKFYLIQRSGLPKFVNDNYSFITTPIVYGADNSGSTTKLFTFLSGGLHSVFDAARYLIKLDPKCKLSFTDNGFEFVTNLTEDELTAAIEDISKYCSISTDETGTYLASVIQQDPSKIGGEDCTFSLEDNVATFGGKIDWYPQDLKLGRKAGNRVGIELEPKVTLADFPNVFLMINGNSYGAEVFEEYDNEGKLWYYPLVEYPGQEFLINIAWDGIHCEQFIIKIAEDAILKTEDEMNQPAPEPEPVELTAITLSPTSESFTASTEATKEITYSLTPEDATITEGFEIEGSMTGLTIQLDQEQKKITLTSDSSIAEGSTTIKLKSKDYPTVEAELTIQVTA